jgi:hypothetical protein
MRIRVLAGLGVLIGALAPAPATAQPFDLDTPADSPVWWPLSDDITAEELRAAYREPGSSQRRYRDAVAAGLAEPRSDASLENLKFYLNPRLTPELETLGSTYFIFAIGWLPWDGAEKTQVELARFGVSAEGREVILAAAEQFRVDFDRLSGELAPSHRELIRLQWEILEREGESAALKKAMREAAHRGDVAYFAERTERGEAEIRVLLEDWKVDPSRVLLETSLPALKADLSPGDWRGLRRYLLDQVVTRLGTFTDF